MFFFSFYHRVYVAGWVSKRVRQWWAIWAVDRELAPQIENQFNSYVSSKRMGPDCTARLKCWLSHLQDMIGYGLSIRGDWGAGSRFSCWWQHLAGRQGGVFELMGVNLSINRLPLYEIISCIARLRTSVEVPTLCWDYTNASRTGNGVASDSLL